MKFLSNIKIAIIALFVIVVLTLGLIISNIKPPSSDQIKFEFTDSHSGVVASKSAGFDDKKLDDEAIDALKSGGIKTVKINLTEDEVPFTTMSYDANNELIPYIGYNLKKEDDMLLISLYLNKDTIDKLKMTDETLTLDANQQIFLAIGDFAKRPGENREVIAEDHNQTINDRFNKSIQQAEYMMQIKNTLINIKNN